MRIDLGDGQWADLREHITHGQDKEIRRARAASRADPVATAGEVDTVALRIYVKSWSVLDPNGETIPLDAADSIDRLPMAIADRLIGTINDLYTGDTRPNSPTPPSSESSSTD